jgi:phage-related protein
MLDAETNQTRTGINTSRSNIKNARNRIHDLQNHLRNNEMTAANAAWADIHRMLTNLEQSFNQMGGNFSSVSNVLKTKHDTAKNAIGNIR